jgi:hypothetical protein
MLDECCCFIKGNQACEKEEILWGGKFLFNKNIPLILKNKLLSHHKLTKFNRNKDLDKI